MLRDDLIALGLHSPHTSQTAPPEPHALEPIERLLTIVRDLIALLEFADDGTLLESIELCRKTLGSATDAQTVYAALERCVNTCAKAVAQIERLRHEQKKEIASLLDMVQEALAIVSGEGQSFNRHIGSSMERFEALVRIDDVRQLKAELVREVAALREIAGERQKAFESTVQKFHHRVQVLERQLTASRQEATLDPLTRIANRGGFDRACQRWISTDKPQFVLAMIDLDDFKQINDLHGHGVGDRALMVVAQVLNTSIGADRDFVARIGGDEFALLIADVTPARAESRLRAMLTGLAKSRLETTTGLGLSLTCSCGIAEYSAGDTVESLMERADRALYKAKHLGKNRVVTNLKPTLRELRRH